MEALGWQAWFSMAVLAALLAALTFTSVAADVVMVGGVALLLLAGVVTPKEAFAGFANEGAITVGVLYVVVAGLRETGVMSDVAQRLFGQPRSTTAAQLRMMIPTAAISAFMNNTPLVAALLPAVSEWAKKYRLSISALLMPLSFSTILGGLCTLIGTSTNVVAAGLVAEAQRAGRIDFELGFFTLSWIGVPCAIAGITFIALASRWLLPERKPPISDADDPRAYTVEMLVVAGGPVDGLTIEAAGLRHLPNAYLAEVDRDGEVIAAVAPTLRLHGGDRLIFVGVVDSVVELQRLRGLVPATDQVFKLDGERSGRVLIEAVVSDQCPLLGQSIREGRFRTAYSAAVIAVARSGDRLSQKIGDVVLRAGDTLLLEARPAFVQQHRNSRDFFLVSAVEDSRPPRTDKRWLSLAILIAMVGLATLFEQAPAFQQRELGMLHAALLAAGAMVATRCCSASIARAAVDWQVLIVIGATFGLGKALEKTGAAAFFADSMVGLAGESPGVQLAMLYLLTMLLTEILSNTTAIVLAFPIALATAANLGVNPLPFVVAITIAASCGFATPVGYQTNLMVYGPGGYRFSDFLRLGGALNLIVAIVTVTLAPLVFPF
jgi:di/tricarboxylate transporter